MAHWVCPSVDNTHREFRVQSRERIAQNNRSCSTENGFVDTMGVDSRPLRTENELRPAEVVVILRNRKTRAPGHTRVVLERRDTLASPLIVCCLREVCINLNVSRDIGTLEGGEKRKLSVDEPEWNRRQARVLHRRIDRVDVSTNRKEHSKLNPSKWAVCVVNNDMKLLRREEWTLRAKLRQIVSVDKHPIPMACRSIGKPRAVWIARVNHPPTSVCKGLSRNHIG